MSLNIAAFVTGRLAPAITLDNTLPAAITTEIAAQHALQGWTIGDTTDAQGVYIGLLTIKGLIARILLQFSVRLESAKGGPAEVKFQKAIDYLKQLENNLDDQIRSAQHLPEVDVPLQDLTDVPILATLAGWRNL
jgi:hypothetical protein